MKLKNILKGINYTLENGDLEINITNISDSSKKISNDGLFICIDGTKTDGHEFIKDAIKKGAKAVIVTKNINVANKTIAVIKLDDSRSAMSDIAANFYGNKFSFKFIGLTGTNGKTTTSFMIRSILMKDNMNVGVIGTSGVFFNSECLRGEDLTTPDPLELFKYLNILEKKSADVVVCEMSAHALYFKKNRGVMTDIAVFSNLTEDHLDFFGNMENYGRAKMSYFSGDASKIGLVNIDDELGRKIQDEYNIPIYSYSVLKKADFYATKINLKKRSFVFTSASEKIKIKLTMPGIYNVYNALSAAGVCTLLGMKLKTIKFGLENMSEVAGRFNVYDFGKKGKVILDFAHTPDGLEKVLTAARGLVRKNGKLISVFGCGGNRDKNKRPIMGEISGTIADYTIISIDNPRYEEPYSVMEDIAVGIKKTSSPYEIVMPREKAIERAVELASKNDVIVVSGKGVEPYYEVKGVKHVYHEDEVIKSLQLRYKK